MLYEVKRYDKNMNLLSTISQDDVSKAYWEGLDFSLWTPLTVDKIDKRVKPKRIAKPKSYGMMECEQCKKTIYKTRSHQKFCLPEDKPLADQCALIYVKLKNKKAPDKRECAICLQIFYSAKYGQNCCQDPCQWKKKYEPRMMRDYHCAVCLKPYSSRYYPSRFCGKPCNHGAWKSKLSREKTQAKREAKQKERKINGKD